VRNNDLKAAGPDAPSHHWFYAPEMRAEEAILIKSYDSAEGRHRPLCAAHLV